VRSCGAAELPIGAGQNQPTDPVGNFSLVEIDQQPNREYLATSCSSRAAPCGLSGFSHSFGFYEHTALYQDIESQGLFSGETFVFDRNELLADELQIAQAQFLQKTPLIDGLN
jgi:hypothetical protein